jgi:hypothetical protein
MFEQVFSKVNHEDTILPIDTDINTYYSYESYNQAVEGYVSMGMDRKCAEELARDRRIAAMDDWTNDFSGLSLEWA